MVIAVGEPELDRELLDAVADELADVLDLGGQDADVAAKAVRLLAESDQRPEVAEPAVVAVDEPDLRQHALLAAGAVDLGGEGALAEALFVEVVAAGRKRVGDLRDDAEGHEAARDLVRRTLRDVGRERPDVGERPGVDRRGRLPGRLGLVGHGSPS